jgi:hypothetical protein
MSISVPETYLGQLKVLRETMNQLGAMVAYDVRPIYILQLQQLNQKIDVEEMSGGSFLPANYGWVLECIKWLHAGNAPPIPYDMWPTRLHTLQPIEANNERIFKQLQDKINGLPIGEQQAAIKFVSSYAFGPKDQTGQPVSPPFPQCCHLHQLPMCCISVS